MAWAEFIIVGFTFWFMVPTIIILGILFYCVAEENPGFALIATGIYILIIQLFSNFNFISWISLNTWTFFKYLIMYVIIGTIFSVIKFWFKLIEERREFDIAFENFLKDKNIQNQGITYKTVPEAFKAECYLRMRSHSLPDIYQSTSKITFWMGYWPLVAIWTLINNPLKWLWEEIKNKLAQLFRDMHQKILGDRTDVLKEWNIANDEKNRKANENTKFPKDWSNS